MILSKNTAQQSVHPTLGILARFQAFFYASAFSQSDGVPPPAPARVTQTVGTPLAQQRLKNKKILCGGKEIKLCK
jgi:hypothetical protein